VEGHGQPPCRGDRLQPRLRGQPLTKGGYAARDRPQGAAAPATRVDAPWQGGYRPQGAVAANAGVAMAT
ncbi:hypothetical protein BHM03_00051089, partial [Ensete ventricosum]